MSFDPEQITLFAKTDARGKEVPFGIKAKDRTKHVYVIGKTGMGKSTLLENMAVQDIKNGNGLAFIDPHGQTAETLLNYIPEERKDDVLYFAPFDTEYPVAFNVMEDVGPDKRHLVVSGLMSVFKKIWVDAWSARMEYILQNTLLALLEYPDSTLLGVNRMLSDKVYRRQVIDNISDPAVKSFWVDEFLNYNERYMQEAGDAIKNKIGQFTANPLIRNIIGQPKSSFDIRQIMDEKKILIMNLSKGLVGESNANLLGSMLTTRIYLAAMSRADLSVDQMKSMPNFYFYVDEFQSFANATFADILSEARKYKLNLTIAHQYIEQMEEEVRNAVFGNVGTIITFRVGPFDAEVLETIYAPQFTATDIVNLGFAQIYLTLMIDGIGSHPFSATTLPPITPAEISYHDVVVSHSRQAFAQKRAEVEAAINAWHAPIEVEKPKDKPRSGASSANNNGRNNERPKHTNKSHGSYDNNKNGNGNSNGGKNGNGNSSNNSWKNNGPANNANKEKPAPPKGKNLDELRAVLKNISQSEKTKSEKKEQAKNGKNKKRGESKNDNSGDLKSALAAVLGNPEVKEDNVRSVSDVKKDISQMGKKEVSEGKSSKTAAPNGTGTKVPETQPVPESVKPEVASVNQSFTATRPAPVFNRQPADDPLAPKKLERMMRVNQSESSPLK